MPTPKIGRGGKTSDQGVRGDYKGNAENLDLDYHKRLQANHITGQQQQGQAIMPPPYMYQPQDLFHNGRSNSSTNVTTSSTHNENRRFDKFSETLNGNKTNKLILTLPTRQNCPSA